MTCFEFRRLSLVHPRERTAEQEAHRTQCAQCAKLTAEAAAFESRLEEAALVQVPDALADRVILRHRMRPAARYGVWAMAAVVLMGAGLWFHRVDERVDDIARPAVALTRDHPAVAAISFVLDHEPRLLRENRSGDPGVMRIAFERLGLHIPEEGVSVRYLGPCPVPGGTGEHIVLVTPYGQATLILVPDYPIGGRVVGANRQMTALSNPVRNGGYILVSSSRQTLREVERMLM